MIAMQSNAIGSGFKSNDNNPVTKNPEATQQQRRAITGTVIDLANGDALIGVTVAIVGTKLVTVTDAKGKFTLNSTNPNAQLKVSYMGYMAQVIDLKGQISISVKLEADVKNLGEVVVVGYGTQKKESVVGAISMVNNASLMKAGSQNITSAIAGKLSGVLTIQQTGEPGADNTEVVVRGESSWNGSAPLTLVDGVERDYSSLDPAEINSVSVLKDASATAVLSLLLLNVVL
jgi:hypothetical protein